MGYSIQAYSVEAEKVKAEFGSKDQNLYKKLKKVFKDDLAGLDEWFEDELEELDKPIKTENLLQEIIEGKIDHPKLSFLYGYIYELLCQFYGSALRPPHDLLAVQYLEYVFEEYSFFINIPKPDDFPHIISLEQKQFEKAKLAMLGIALEGIRRDNSLDEWQEDVKYIFQYCSEKKQELVLFNY